MLLFAVLDASFNMLGVSAYPKLVLRGAIVIAAVAVYTVRSKELAATLALKAHAQRPPLARRINFAVVVFLAFYLVIGFLQPAYLEPAGTMNFLRRAAPLAILAGGKVFVLVSGGFDLSVGSLVTLTVIGGSMLTANDPSNTWWAIGVLYCIGLAVGLINGAVVAYLRTPSIIATLGALLAINGVAMTWCGGSPRGYLPENFRVFGRFVFHDVPLVKIFPLAILVFAVVAALAWWGLHGTVFGRRVFAVGDNPRAAQLAGVRVDLVRIGVFVISALAAVSAGILLGGFGGVSVDVGVGLELQAIAACVVGGVQLMGGGEPSSARSRARSS